MKYAQSNIIGDAGEHLVAAKIIKFFGFPCRLVNIDIGIDIEIEIIDNNLKSTGQFIKGQIKTTNLNSLDIYVDGEHIIYWNKIDIPVVVFRVFLESEKIYWHVVDDLSNYEKGKAGYKISFFESDILTIDNKQKFIDITISSLKKQVIKIYQEAYKIVEEDKNNYLNEYNYDLMDSEELVFHANKIKFDLAKADKIIKKNKNLTILKNEYFSILQEIKKYLSQIEEIKKNVILDAGEDFYKHLDAENFNWD